MRSLAQELGGQIRAEQRASAQPVIEDHPTRTYHAYPKPRPLSEWIVDGQIAEGHEIGGLAFPQRVIATLGRFPEEYAVIGEERYSDGRWFLDFGITEAYVEHVSDYRFLPDHLNPVYVCPDCEAVGGSHQKISIPDKHGGRPLLVKCPRDVSRGFRS